MSLNVGRPHVLWYLTVNEDFSTMHSLLSTIENPDEPPVTGVMYSFFTAGLTRASSNGNEL